MRFFSALLLLCLLWVEGSGAFGQGVDPGQREDAEIERQRILRAADQIDLMVEQHQKILRELETLRAANQAMAKELGERKAEAARLSSQMEEISARQAKEREALLKEVAKLVAEAKPAPAEAKPAPVSARKPTAPAEEGFEHVVAQGETLWAITQAYRAAGTKATMEDIRKANGLKEGQPLRVGQKLFIPKK
ncbi:MAG: hypothetical protein OHK005_07070 [Candidatus Methylacidiphilales bacterium]